MTDDARVPDFVDLRLYVTGATPASARAVVNARRFCETHLAGRYRLEVLDIGEHVAQATEDQVVAAPTLIRLAPLPLRRFIGDLSDAERLRRGLDPMRTLEVLPAAGVSQ